MKRGIVLAWLAFLASCIAFLFWRNEWKYSLPTPVPTNYQEVARGATISLPAVLASAGTSRPRLLHFFNPDCPCSRFNMPYFKNLVTQYGLKADFAVILMTAKPYTDQQVRERFGIPNTVTILKDSALAARCGVYSTPQAVILDKDDKLYYRGNYNRARYCNDKKTNYAEIALQGLLQNKLLTNFSPLALKAYGCTLPTCTQ